MVAAMVDYRKPAGNIKRIHVDQYLIRKGERNVLTIQESKGSTKAKEIHILDDNGNVVAKVIHDPEKPLSCGAKAWVETHNELVVIT